MNAGALAHALDRLSSTGRVLYVAAHPDDENTRLLTYLANERHLTVAYLSMTRGGGGQNLIGTEQAELLDLVRTEELLAARALDGAQQRFTRMRDFGYTKTPEETFQFWGHEEALADVVWVIRKFQPDVMITRFDELPPNHGHHTASAVLAREAFTAAADAKRFPEQLSRGVTVWQVDRMLNNVSPWREGPPPAGAIELDVGAYDPRLGVSYGELAAFSRSQHKSQGFGVPGERGPLIEKFLPMFGTKPARDLLEGLDTSWARFGANAAAYTKAIEEARSLLERDRPERAVPALVRAHIALDALPDVQRVRDARESLVAVLSSAAGLFVRATAPKPVVVPGDAVKLRAEIILRRPAAGVTLSRVVFPGAPALEVNTPLGWNVKKEVSSDVTVPAATPVSSPYYLAERPDPGRWRLKDMSLVGEPRGPAPMVVAVELTVAGRSIHLDAPVLYGWTDQVHGERLRSFLVVPPATVTPARAAVIFPNGQASPVSLRVRAGKDDVKGELTLQLPEGWKSVPERAPVALAKAGDETTVTIKVTPPANAKVTEISPAIDVGGKLWSVREDVIDHPHIPMQVVLQTSRLKLTPVSLRVPKGLIGYIMGSGDTVADDLAHAGMSVELIDDERLRSGDLGKYSAIVAGIRAYNTRDAMKAAHERLMKYVEKGGTYVVQYNTHSRIAPLESPIGPYPIELGRGRITDETAVMTPVNPKHALLTAPNVIEKSDFDGWVQERGLYYAEKFDPKYETIFSAADPGEQPITGGVLTVRHGRGRYTYTGLAFFRQLPAGVPGAYRLFTNMIAGK